MFPRRLHITLALIGQAVSEKKMFEINIKIHVHDSETKNSFININILSLGHLL